MAQGIMMNEYSAKFVISTHLGYFGMSDTSELKYYHNLNLCLRDFDWLWQQCRKII